MASTQVESLYTEVTTKIENKTVTADDFNKLISEAMPESVRDRVRRRTIVSPEESHIDTDGHQQLKAPDLAKRVQPKRERSGNTQMTGRGKIAHKHSAKTQAREAASTAVSENAILAQLLTSMEELHKLLLSQDIKKNMTPIKESIDNVTKLVGLLELDNE